MFKPGAVKKRLAPLHGGQRLVANRKGPKHIADWFPLQELNTFEDAPATALRACCRRQELNFYVFRSYADCAWDFILATARAPAKVTLFRAQNIPN